MKIALGIFSQRYFVFYQIFIFISIFSFIWKKMEMIFFIFLPSLKIKSATTEAVAQKTQTPIVAKLTVCEIGALHIHIVGICIFIKFVTMGYGNKRILSYKRKNTPNFTVVQLVWQSHCSIVFLRLQEKHKKTACGDCRRLFLRL